MSNITGIPPAPATDLRKLLDGWKRNFHEHVELQEMLAKMDKATFDSYVKAGFTKGEAIELLKASKIKANI